MMKYDTAWIAYAGIFFVLLFGLLLFIIILEWIAEWKIYKKCGKKGWECIIPFYNKWVLVEMAELNWWWFFLLISPTIVNLIFPNSNSFLTVCHLGRIFAIFQCYYNLSKKFHKDTGFAILMTIFPFIMLPIVAFGKNYEFDSSVEVSTNGIFDQTVNKDTTSPTKKYCIYCGKQVNPSDKFCEQCGKEIK